MDQSTLATTGAVVLTALMTFLGLMFKRSVDRQKLKDDVETTRAEREQKSAQAVYDQMQEDLTATRTELRAVQDDLGRARTEMGTLWSQMTAMRRELDASEAHIADWHRWADSGAQGPRPVRKSS